MNKPRKVKQNFGFIKSKKIAQEAERNFPARTEMQADLLTKSEPKLQGGPKKEKGFAFIKSKKQTNPIENLHADNKNKNDFDFFFGDQAKNDKINDIEFTESKNMLKVRERNH